MLKVIFRFVWTCVYSKGKAGNVGTLKFLVKFYSLEILLDLNYDGEISVPNFFKCTYKGFPNRGDMILNVPIGLI